MARAAKPTTSKARAGRNARERKGAGSARTAKKSAAKTAAPKRTAAARGAASTQRSAAKRTAAKAQNRRAQSPSETWGTNVGLLLSTQVGREILAEVLNAAATVLRQTRNIGRQVQDAGEAALDRSANLATTAVDVGSEVASGAVDAGVEMTAAAVDMVQTATETLANVTADAVRNILPGAGTAEDQSRKGEGRRGSGKGRQGGEES